MRIKLWDKDSLSIYSPNLDTSNNMMDTSGINRDTSGAMMDTSLPSNDTLTPNLDTSKANLDTSEISMDTSSAMMDTSKEVSVKPRIKKGEMEQIILDICKEEHKTLDELGILIDKTPKYLKNSIIPILIKNGKLKRLYPNIPNHPSQAYKSAE